MMINVEISLIDKHACSKAMSTNKQPESIATIDQTIVWEWNR